MQHNQIFAAIKTLATLQVNTMNRVLLLPLLALILSEGTVALGDNGPPGDKSVQQLLEDALLNDPCNLNKLQTQFPTGDLPPLTCVPVTYKFCPLSYILCNAEFNDATLSNYSYLWTTFNTEKKIPGQFILLWLLSEIFIPGLGLEGVCKYSLDDALILYLEVDKDTLSNRAEVVKALKRITLKVSGKYYPTDIATILVSK